MTTRKKREPATPKAKTTAAKPAKADRKKRAARTETKGAQIIELMKRSGGATLKEVMKATGWQSHSVRGFVAGTLGKKMGLKVESTKSESGDRTYAIK